ncbi:glycosyltransferase family 4 protein [uncultured Alsobacter sp.]|uniref:glycosyltransferase family 4 protein n=1 Tax=uncultured Alsobacter sp. TaxID=1748258 RepID=UPI0025E7EC6B|nr:glycosyltransferase family 4 protein [uncultured Alsobacter sp.]
MDILFVHNNFPGQYLHLATHLAKRPGYRVFAIGNDKCAGVPGVTIARYKIRKLPPEGLHPFAARFDSESRRAEGVLQAALALRKAGVEPAVIAVHPGWGENLPLKDVWPDARLVVFCEFFYRPEGADVGFDPEFAQTDVARMVRLRAKNAAQLLALVDAQAGVAPTRWQRSLYPDAFLDRISVVHDGIDTRWIRPDTPERIVLPTGHALNPGEEIVTFVGRNLEPYRGYHVFMRALPAIMAARPQARIVIVGGEGVSYGAAAPEGTTWKQVFLDEVRGRIDPTRVIFAGMLDHPTFVKLFRLSSVHVYLTYPFVLSWSMLEAMATGCLVVGSATPPVEEIIRDGQNGLLVPFFDTAALAERVIEACARPGAFRPLREAARRLVVEQYDLATVCLPAQLALMGLGDA